MHNAMKYDFKITIFVPAVGLMHQRNICYDSVQALPGTVIQWYLINLLWRWNAYQNIEKCLKIEEICKIMEFSNQYKFEIEPQIEFCKTELQLLVIQT